jgi:hypothetical protein
VGTNRPQFEMDGVSASSDLLIEPDSQGDLGVGGNVSVCPFPRQGVWMDPGMLHAVMAVTCSCVTGWKFVDMKRIEDDDCVRRIMNWELELLRRRKKNPDGPFENPG